MGVGWNDAAELIVAGDGQFYVASVGTALPTTGPTQALNSAFSGLGYHNEEGVSIKSTPEIKEIKAWQSRHAIRRELVGLEAMITCQLLQWNEVTVPFAFGGGVITDLGSGKYRYDFPEDTAQLQEKAVVIDCKDGLINYRFVFPRGNVVEAVEAAFSRDDAAGLPISFNALAPSDGGSFGYFLTDSPAFVPGS